MTAPPGPDRRSHVLAIDLGTGGPKVGLVDFDGAITWRAHREVETRHLPGGGAVQDPDDWWDAILSMGRDAVRSGLVDPAAIVAVACTGQYASTVPVDASGAPTGDCLLWMDRRGGPFARERFGGPVAGFDPRILATSIRRSGGAPDLSGADPIGHRLFIDAEQPEVLGRSRWLMEPIDQLTLRFCGMAAATPATMAAAWLIDVRQPSPIDYDEALVRNAGVGRRHLPPLRPIGSVAGTILPEVAGRLGLGEDVAVVTAAPDLHTAALGSGAVAAHATHLALSTSSWISCPIGRKQTDVRRQIATVPGLVAGENLVIDNHEVGASALAWWRGRVSEMEAARGGRAPGFEDLEAAAAAVPPGSGGVMFAPWLAGERSPVDDRRTRAGFTNLSLSVGRDHMTRAVYEGVAHNSRWLFEAVEHFVGRRLDPLRIVGGGAVSDLWCQIHADVLDRVIERPADPRNANLRGAALHAAVALGVRTLSDVAGSVGVDARFEPNPANRDVYDRMFRELPELYRRQRPIFHRLAALDAPRARTR